MKNVATHIPQGRHRHHCRRAARRACPSGWVGGVYAEDGPETKTIRFGIIALTDCAPIVMAHELGYFKKFGIESIVSKEASWAVIRDKLSLGENQATHMLIGMPLASTMGLAGSPVKPMVIPWLLNRNGQAITLNNKLKAAGVRKPARRQAARRQGQGRRRAADLRDDVPARHARDVDALLAGAGGIHPGQGRQPHHDSAAADGRQHEGRQDGRLLRRRAVEQPRHRGRHRLHRRSPRSRCGRTTPRRCARSPRSSPTKNPKTVKAMLKALHLASVDLDKMENRPKFAEVIARPTYINCPPAIILERLMGKYQYGDGRVEQDPFYMIYSNRNTNYPHQIYAQVVAHAVPPLGHGQGRARLRRHPQAGPAPRPVSRGDEGARRPGEGRRGTEDHALRRRLRRQGSGEVRAVVPHQQLRA